MITKLPSRKNQGINTSFIIKIIILMGLTLLGAISATIISLPFLSLKSPAYLWLLQAISALFTFLIPALIYGRLSEKNLSSYFNLHTIKLKDFIRAIIILLSIQPLIAIVGAWNQNIIFPESLKGIENLFKEIELALNQIIESMLSNRSWWAISINFIVIAALAGITEEFFFRGALLNIFREKIKNPHSVIWIVAVIFSAVHVQFYGFFPRIILGALMGYLLYWTGNLWIPIMTHTINNALAVFTWESVNNSNSDFLTSTPKIILISLLIGGIAITYFMISKLQRDNSSEKSIKEIKE